MAAVHQLECVIRHLQAVPPCNFSSQHRCFCSYGLLTSSGLLTHRSHQDVVRGWGQSNWFVRMLTHWPGQIAQICLKPWHIAKRNIKHSKMTSLPLIHESLQWLNSEVLNKEVPTMAIYNLVKPNTTICFPNVESETNKYPDGDKMSVESQTSDCFG